MTLRLRGRFTINGGFKGGDEAGQTSYTYGDWINQYSSKIYVETTGNDTTGTGTQGNPYATLEKAVTEASDDTAIVIGSGTFAATEHVSPYGGGGLVDDDKRLHFFGTPGETIIETSASGKRDIHMIATRNAGTTIQGIIFNHDPSPRTTNYSTALFSYDYTTATKGIISNCVFNSPVITTIGLTYNNSNTNNFVVRNCSFTVNGWIAASSGDNADNTFIDSAFVTALSASDGVTKTNLVNGVTFDGDYHITAGGSDATHGVYAGPLSWSSPSAPTGGVSSTPVAGHDFIAWFPTDGEEVDLLASGYYEDVNIARYDLGVVSSVNRPDVSGNNSLQLAPVDTVVTLDQTYTSYTISMWLDNTYNTGTSGGWYGRRVNVGTETFGVYRDGFVGDSLVYAYPTLSNREVSDTSLINFNGIHHLVWTRNGTTVKFYANGVLHGTFTSGATASMSSFTIVNSETNNTSGTFRRLNLAVFDGEMDATDVSTLYGLGSTALSDRTNY
jgi:hypothetical protein